MGSYGLVVANLYNEAITWTLKKIKTDLIPRSSFSYLDILTERHLSNKLSNVSTFFILFLC